MTSGAHTLFTVTMDRSLFHVHVNYPTLNKKQHALRGEVISIFCVVIYITLNKKEIFWTLSAILAIKGGSDQTTDKFG